VKRFRGGLVFKAHRLLYHSTLGLRVIKKKKKVPRRTTDCFQCVFGVPGAVDRATCVHSKSRGMDGLVLSRHIPEFGIDLQPIGQRTLFDLLSSEEGTT